MRSKKIIKRSRRGQMGLFFILLTALVGISFGALAMDFAHMSTVRTELHNATDAAALAGAQDLWRNPDQCAANAYAVAALNRADGQPVADSTPGCDVNVTVTLPTNDTHGQVQVDASMQVTHWFAPFASHWTDTVQVSSVAGTVGKLVRLNAGQALPIALSLDQTPVDHKGKPLGMPLNQLKPGDSITLYIGSQDMKNAAFTSLTAGSANSSTINTMIDEVLGFDTKKQIDIPSVAVGDMINLNNGVMGMKDLGKEPTYSALLNEPFFVVPVIGGAPAYNQSSPVVGFAGLKITSIDNKANNGITLTITGTLMNMPQVDGQSGVVNTTGNTTDDQAIERLDLGPIQLIR